MSSVLHRPRGGSSQTATTFFADLLRLLELPSPMRRDNVGTIRYGPAGAGTMEAGNTDGVNEMTIWPSYLSDAPADLAQALIALLQGAQRVTCSWQDETGQCRWLFVRREDELEIKILWFEETFSRKPGGQGDLRFSTRSTLVRFAAQVHAQLRRLLVSEGAEAYRREWRHDFPVAELERLGKLIRRS